MYKIYCIQNVRLKKKNKILIFPKNAYEQVIEEIQPSNYLILLN